MKKVGFGCLVAMVMILVAFGVALWATRDLPKAADAFFSRVREGKIHEAYLETASEFQAATSEEAFTEFLDRTALKNYQSASWSSRSIKNNTGTLEGTLTTRNGGKIPLVMDFVKEGKTWKILALRKAEAGIVKEMPEPELPSDKDLRLLTSTSLSALGAAINKRNFEDFYDGLSELWKSQVTAGELKEAFSDFIEKNIDLTRVSYKTPVFSKKPAINEDGVLVLEGYYTTQPAQVNFVLKYVYEHPQWKLVGVNVKL